MHYSHHEIPGKANRILRLVLIALLLIIIRVWYLAVIQYDQRVEDSRKPQRKVVIEPAIRSSIRDRFNIPLALNKISYQATILYSQIRDIPSIAWKYDEQTGKRVKIFQRKEYIQKLSQVLANQLGLEAERVEDLIYAKATYYSQVPFVIKEDLSEEEYYQLKIAEKDWPGIHARIVPKRYYPQGRVASDIVGYMGAINRGEYEKILHEVKALKKIILAHENGEEVELPIGIQQIKHVRNRLKELEAKAYTIHDYVGKTGIEGMFEEKLRGFSGKKKFYSDSKGNFLYELPGSQPTLAGQRILLTISSELQEYAEQLLAQNEEVRLVRKCNIKGNKKTVIAKKHPWIKGGAIIAMDPHSADVLAMASYPRFDPNDFISVTQIEEQQKKKMCLQRWLENDTYLGQIWNQQQPLERERFHEKKKEFYDEQLWLTWSNYLGFVLPKDSAVSHSITQIETIAQALFLLQQIDLLLEVFPTFNLYKIFNFLYFADESEAHPIELTPTEKDQFTLHVQIQNKQQELQSIKNQLNIYMKDLFHNYDKVLLIDLLRLLVKSENFSNELLIAKGEETLENYHIQLGFLLTIVHWTEEKTKEIFHETNFKTWREKEGKQFLLQKRQEEKANKQYPKPYIDYLDQEEKTQFTAFWKKFNWSIIYAFLKGSTKDSFSSDNKLLEEYLLYFHQWYREIKEGAHAHIPWRPAYISLQKTVRGLPRELAIQYLAGMRPYAQLTRPLLGHYRYIRNAEKPTEKDLAAAFYPLHGFGYGRSFAYRQATIQGSLFKLITAYQALKERNHKVEEKKLSSAEINPLVIVEQFHQKGNVSYIGYTEEGKLLPQLYKGGRLPRSLAHQDAGRIDLIKALEVSSNPYFSLLAGECIENPENLADAARLFSYGKRTGIHLPGEIPGKIPSDLTTNRTGLYTMAIGQHTLVVTPLQTTVMLSAIANGGKVLQPKIVKLTVEQKPLQVDDKIVCLPTFPYQESLALVGVDFPLFSVPSKKQPKNLICEAPLIVNKEIPLPENVRRVLLKGLKAATQRAHQDNLSSLSRLYGKYPEAIQQFTELKEQLLGKSSTSEVVENIDLDRQEGTSIYTHVWFGSIAFEEKKICQNKATYLFKDEFGQPELIVVVYLRFGGYGKEAAPLAAQMVKKWREIKQKHAK